MKPAPLYLGIEGGGTRTVALLADDTGRQIQRVESGPANLRLLSDTALVRHLKTLAAQMPRPNAVGIGLAGARTEPDHTRIRQAAARVWPGIPCHAGDDLETALAAAGTPDEDSSVAQVLVLSGTGSCCYGQTKDGRTAKAGGWGHILGDQGSAHDIALRALRQVVQHYDLDGNWPRLGARLLRYLQFNEPNELIAWAQRSDKAAIADLAVEVFAAAKQGDKTAAAILEEALESLARGAIACARRSADPGNRVQFIFSGSVLLKQPAFARRLAARIHKGWPGARCAALQRESAWGAVTLAQQLAGKALPGKASERRSQSPQLPPAPVELSPTELRNPRSLNLDRLSLSRAIELMLSEDAKIPGAILDERGNLERAINMVVHAFQNKGRLFYVGAGTSGRLGVLDASECPPTFRAPPEMVQGIIAGGREALWRAVEGAEDDFDSGERAAQFREINSRDVIIGITASGRAPFVWGALRAARRVKAKTAMICFNPGLKIPTGIRPDVVIAPQTGPEILTGSTRLKAGTATKLMLNILTTLAMTRLGKVKSNLMIDLNPSNAKLRDRAVRIVQALCGVRPEEANKALAASRWIVKDACARLSRKDRR